MYNYMASEMKQPTSFLTVLHAYTSERKSEKNPVSIWLGWVNSRNSIIGRKQTMLNIAGDWTRTVAWAATMMLSKVLVNIERRPRIEVRLSWAVQSQAVAGPWATGIVDHN